MNDVDEFTATVVPLLHDDIVGLHNGDIAPRMALWSPNEPVTLFGAELNARGWDEVGPAFERLAASFTGSQSCEYEVLAAESSGDLGYVVAIEHSVAASYEGEPERYTLRVNHHFPAGERRVEGRSPAWRSERCCRPGDAGEAGQGRWRCRWRDGPRSLTPDRQSQSTE